MGEPDAVAPRGMVATSHPLAVRAALEMLDAGGTAADAAVAAAAVLTVVDPRSTGLGGDAFALYWEPGASRPVGLAAAGCAPAGLHLDALRAAGHRTMPVDGAWSITVPGAPAGWEVLLARFGRLDVGRVLGPAIALAEEGTPVLPAVAAEWASTVPKLQRSLDEGVRPFLPGGRAPRPDERFAIPELAATLRTFAAEGAAPFYGGALAERIGAAVEAAGGPLRAADLAAWDGPTWVDPICTGFRGLDVFQLPPPNQGLVVLEALGIYGGLATDGVVDADHASIEALKLAYEDANRHIADPDVAPVPVERLLSADHLADQRARITPDAVLAGDVGRPSDTVYLAVADAEGGACSFIQSVYDGFGSGIGVPGTGLMLQNRASGFTMAEGHPNCVAPGKRPFHTIIPAMLGRGSELAGCLGVVGGYMQPQGQVQILRNLLDRGMTAQEAVDAPRFRVYRDREVALEDGYPDEVARGLAERGHMIVRLDPHERGGAQLVLRDADGFRGGSDSRKDGFAGGR